MRQAGLFNRVERESAPSYSADPSDQYYQFATPSAAPVRYQRQKWIWEHTDALEAWDLSSGGATIAVVDSGIEYRPTGPWTYHPELDVKVLRLQSAPGIGRSAAFAPAGISDELSLGSSSIGHGTHVAGLVGALSQNDQVVGSNPIAYRGLVGGCPLCVLSIIKLAGAPLNISFNLARRQGVQVINRSGARNDPDLGDIEDQCLDPTIVQPEEDLTLEDLPFELEANDCPLLREITRREIPMVVSAGNHRRELGFPADQSFMIAVSGTDINEAGQPIFWDEFGTADCTAAVTDLERGSNRACRTAALPHRKAPDFAAPARRVLSTFAVNQTWASRCSDLTPQPFPSPPGDESVFTGIGQDGEAYEWCTGTSMSAPIVSGVIGLLRTANPLIRRESIVTLLRQSALIPGVATPLAVQDERWGWGMPQAGEALKDLYGVVGSGSPQPVRNRLTPMFHLSNPWTGIASTPKRCSKAANEAGPMVSWRASGAHLHTTKPQVAVAALLNELYVDGRELAAQSSIEGINDDGTFCAPSRELAFTRPNDIQATRAIGFPILPFDATGLQVSDEHEIPRARFHLFTGPVSPKEGLNLIALVRFGYDDPWPLNNEATPPFTGPLIGTGVMINAQFQIHPQACPGLTRDFVYGSLSDLAYWQGIDPCPEDDALLASYGFNARYHLDGIEGYLFAQCPPEFASGPGCNGLDGRPMPIYLRSPARFIGENGTNLQNWALIAGPDLPENNGGAGPWAGYTLCSERQPAGPPCGLLGYAFPNTDSDGDGLIDGEEWLIGTNRLNPDSDSDGYSDGFERDVGGAVGSGVHSATHFPHSNPLDANSVPSDLIFKAGVQ